MTVFISHLTFPAFTGGVVRYQGEWAGAGVATFFVLSGYVICYVATEKERTLSAFAISRLARVYSVAVPAIALTIAVDLISMRLGWPRNIPEYQYAQFPKYLLSALTFINQAGPLHEPTFGNAVFWSLDYEVWYYIIFATAVYFIGVKRVVLVALSLAISGPRAAIYLPIWLAGVALYKVHGRVSIGRIPAITLFAGSLAALFCIRLTGLDTAANELSNSALGGLPNRSFSNSAHFAGDYMIAACIAVNIFAACYTPLDWLTRPTIARTIVYLASFTFALYLMHRPLMDLFRYGLPYDPLSSVSVAMLVALVLMSVWLLGFVTEHQKRRWRGMFKRMAERISSRAG